MNEPVEDEPVEDEPVEDEPVEVFKIAGIFRRVIAIIIDTAIVAIPLLIFGFALGDLAYRLGPWGRLLGIGVMVLYSGLLNSTLVHGQTVGKQLMGIVVLAEDGTFLTIRRSVLRSAVLYSIFLFNGWGLPAFQEPIPLFIASVIIFGGGAAMIYGLLLNRRTRQGIHDLLVGSYVVVKDEAKEAVAPVPPKWHTRITYGLLAIGIVAGGTGLYFRENPSQLGILQPGEWAELLSMQQALMDQGQYHSVTVHRSFQSQLGQDNTIQLLTITLWVKRSCRQEAEQCRDSIDAVARQVFDEYNHMDSLDGIIISAENRFDLGLARGHVRSSVSWSIEQWREYLAIEN